MLSVVLCTHSSERALVRTLAALVPGATAGLVREVIVADAGSHDTTAEVADVAGCRFLASDAPLGRRWVEAAEAARAQWLLFLTVGAVLQAGWVEDASRFVDEAVQSGRADEVVAVFRVLPHSRIAVSPLREAIALAARAAGLVRPDTEGLLMTRTLFLRLADAVADAVEPRFAVMRRLGRRAIVTLQSGATRLRSEQ